MKLLYAGAAALLVASATSFTHTLAAPVKTASVPAATTMTDGEIRKVDREAGKLTLRHGPITNLEMPGMTMVFRVADPAMLEGLKEGDKVRFSADRVNGAITVMRIETIK